MGKPITIAYEPEHACEEGCNCAKDSGYVDLVQQSLADLGSDDPAGDVARNAKYVRGAKKAGLEPKQAAAMILAMSQRDPADYQPRYRYEDVAETAHEGGIRWTARGEDMWVGHSLSGLYVVSRALDGIWRTSYESKTREMGGSSQIGEFRSAEDAKQAAEHFELTVAPIYRTRSAETAHEYVAVDHRGKKVFGPTRDYGEAKMHADRSGGVVRFEMGAGEADEPRSRRPLEDVYQEDRAQAERAATQALSALGIQYTRLSERQRMMSGTFVLQADGSENTPAPPGYPGLARMPIHVEVYKKTTTVARGMASMQTFPYGYRGIGAREDTEAGEGPHSAPATKRECTVDSSTAIAAQIPGGPWKYLKTYPKEAPARIERRRDFDVKMPDGPMGRVTANFCGKHLLLRCPVTQKQFLFESVCVGDVPGPAGLPPRPEVQPVKGKPFTVKIRRGRDILKESGPFAKVTEAVQSFQDKSGFESGDTATVYDGPKVADYRGGRVVFVFGRTRWSRA